MKEDHVKNNENQIQALYKSLLESWNKNSAVDFAKLFAKDGSTVGFDGSQLDGQMQIEKELSRIFSEHKVASYIGIVLEIRELSPVVYLLRAVAGMIPPGQNEINPKVNAIQTLVAQKEENEFRISIFQNTPAAFHGRPEAGLELTNELQEAFNNRQKNGAVK